MSTEVKMDKIPDCSFCDELAEYDGETKDGPWAYMCKRHFFHLGIGLGLGRGQKLVQA